MCRGADAPVAVTALSKNNAAWPSRQDISNAVEKLEGRLHTHKIAEMEGYAPLADLLKSIETRHKSFLTFPGTRRQVIATLERISAALDLLPESPLDQLSQDDIKTRFVAAIQAQTQIARELGQAIPDGSQYLTHRHFTAAILLLLAVSLWLATKYCGGVFWIAAAIPCAPLISPTAQFLTGRAIDCFTIATLSSKQLYNLAGSIKAKMIERGNAEMIKSTQGDFERVKNAMASLERSQKSLEQTLDQRIGALKIQVETEQAQHLQQVIKDAVGKAVEALRQELRTEITATSAQLRETNAGQVAIIQMLTSMQHDRKYATAANSATAANDAEPSSKLGAYV